MSQNLSINSLYSGGLIVNYCCSSACAHCLYRGGPKRDKAYINPEQTHKNLRCLKRFGCNSIHIGGGEPLLQVDGLKDVLRVAQQEGVGVDYVETNSSWFRSPGQADGVISELMELGVTTLLLSVSPFHNAYIPFYKTKEVMKSCRRCGMGIFPWIMDFFSDIDSFDDSVPHSLDEYEEKFGAEWLMEARCRYNLTPGGRTLDTYADRLPQIPWKQVLNDSSSRCTNLAHTGHFHVDLYGLYIPSLCTGTGILIEDIGKELSPENYPTLTALYNSGLFGLYEQAFKEGFRAKDTYSSQCHFCSHIRTYLARNCAEQFPDLRPVEFYSEGK